MHRTRSLNRKSEDIARTNTYPLSPIEEPLRMPGAFGTVDDWELVAPEKRVVVNMARTEEEQAGEILTAPASPTMSPTPGQVPSADVAFKTAEMEVEDIEKPTERFKRVIERMQQAVLSVSPDVHFPPPSLLETLREQEQEQQSSEVTSIPGRPLLGRMHSYAGVTSPSMSASSSEGLPTSSSVPALLSAGAGSTINTPLTAATKISIVARAGLASLMTGNNSLVSQRNRTILLHHRKTDSMRRCRMAHSGIKVFPACSKNKRKTHKHPAICASRHSGANLFTTTTSTRITLGFSRRICHPQLLLFSEMHPYPTFAQFSPI